MWLVGNVQGLALTQVRGAPKPIWGPPCQTGNPSAQRHAVTF